MLRIKKQTWVIVVVVCVIVVISLAFLLFFLTNTFNSFLNNPSTKPSSVESVEPEIITELNQTFSNDRVEITATEIITLPIREPFGDLSETSEDEVAVAVKFVVKNISDSGEFSGRTFITAYVDDALVQSGSIMSLVDYDKFPGKELSGIYCAWQTYRGIPNCYCFKERKAYRVAM